MSQNPVAEEDAILAYVKAHLLDGRVYEDIPDDTELARFPDDYASVGLRGMVMPYIVIEFGVPYDVASDDRTITGEEDQPLLLPIYGECWAAVKKHARQTRGALVDLLRGWTPDTAGNAGALRAFGGGSATRRDGIGRPTRFMQGANFAMPFNYSRPI